MSADRIVLFVVLLAAGGCGGSGRPDEAAESGRPAAAQPAAKTPVPSSDHPWYVERRELYYGIPTLVSFAPADKDLAKAAWTYLESVDAVFNDYRDDSEIGRINVAERRDRVKISSDLAAAFRLSVELCRSTDGAFDITSGPLRRLWKSAAKRSKLPTAEQIAQVRKACGIDKFRLDGHRLTVPSPAVKFDFGGVIKGMAVDRVVAMLRSAGVHSALVQIGGETAAFGLSRSSGKPHVIGVQHPIDMDRIWLALADPGTGLSTATSGNYRTPIIVEGKTLYHIYDTRTGRPIDTHILSVTVVFRQTGNNGLADGLATACGVLGHKTALPLVEKFGADALILVAEDGQIREHKTSGWDALVADLADGK